MYKEKNDIKSTIPTHCQQGAQIKSNPMLRQRQRTDYLMYRSIDACFQVLAKGTEIDKPKVRMNHKNM
jgi:hypothetical protein